MIPVRGLLQRRKASYLGVVPPHSTFLQLKDKGQLNSYSKSRRKDHPSRCHRLDKKLVLAAAYRVTRVNRDQHRNAFARP
ncbi:hypothetical protein M0804_008836 [Polistes exclamans]|nr:hypothetical protein M0804_008836 [Polistes exclamans]